MIKKQFTLREYQTAFQRNISIAVRDYQRVIACSATGSGKTKTFIDTAAKALAKGRTVLIISESIKIFRQIQAEISATEIADGKNYKTIQPGFCYLAMAQTLRRRPLLIEQFKEMGSSLLVIYDECHVGTGSSTLVALDQALIIGFSATPEGKHLQAIYRQCVVGPQPHELVNSGMLCGYQHRMRKRAANIDRLRLNSAGDDYSEESQEEVFESDEVYEGLMEDLRTVKYRKGLIYCASIRDCEHTYNTLTEAGFFCVRMHTGMDKEMQIEQMKRFEKGLIPLMINVGMLTKGYDYPPVDLIVLKLKTKKLSKYIQMVGRGSRVLEHEILLPIGERSKQKFTCLDYGLNWEMHKDWDYEHDWANIWQGKPKREGVPPRKYCPQCEYLCAVSAKKCPNCGHEFLTFNTPDEPVEQPETVLVDVTGQYAKLTNRNISQLNPQELAVYAKAKNKRQFAIRVARARAQSDPEYLRAFGAAMSYKWAWAQRMLDDLPTEKIEYTDILLR